MTPAIDAFLDRELREGNRLFFHSAWMTPEMASRRNNSSEGVHAVFLHEPEEEAILQSMVERQPRESPRERQIRLAAMAWRYGNWLREVNAWGCRQ